MQWGSKNRFQTTGFQLSIGGALIIAIGFILTVFTGYDNFLADQHYSKFLFSLATTIVGSGILVIGVAVMVAGSLRDN